VLAALTACAAGVGYGGAGYALVDVGYAGDFYEPYGYDYGGWGGHYHVGPPRGGGGHPHGGGHPGAVDTRPGPRTLV
jgi:hypothetical protein